MRAQQTNSGTAVGITLLLLFCLLFAQGLGLTHSIAHAHPAGTPQVGNAYANATANVNANAAGSFLHDASTSCAAFDEACVGASLYTPGFVLSLLPGTAVLSLWAAFQSWEHTFQRLFSSRAPPFA